MKSCAECPNLLGGMWCEASQTEDGENRFIEEPFGDPPEWCPVNIENEESQDDENDYAYAKLVKNLYDDETE